MAVVLFSSASSLDSRLERMEEYCCLTEATVVAVVAVELSEESEESLDASVTEQLLMNGTHIETTRMTANRTMTTFMPVEVWFLSKAMGALPYSLVESVVAATEVCAAASACSCANVLEFEATYMPAK